VIARPGAAIQVQVFDGRHIPYDDHSFDTVMFVDVLHHTRNSDELLQEARRVARRAIIIKDHLCAGRLDAVTLRVMDWVGNRPHGVTLTYDYLSAEEWRAMFRRHRLRVAYWAGEIGLYPWPASLFFGRSLHFIAKLVPH
jgi:SAM-dependent methyltransferase